MVFQWRYADEAGVVTDGPAIAFDSQEAAEEWLTDSFAELMDTGVAEVSLFNDHSAVYGPMALAAA